MNVVWGAEYHAQSSCPRRQEVREKIGELKAGDHQAAAWWASKIEWTGHKNAVLIPAPPSEDGRGMWPARQLAIELARRGAGRVAACVERRHEVPGSHRRRRRGRPGVPRERQRRSMGWSGDLPAGDIWLVDDVLTTGQTLQAAADVLQAQCGKRPVGYLVAAVAMYTPVPAEVLWVDRIKKTSRDPGEQQGPR